jgi:multiple sugar transport system ATP-binding protein
VTVNLVEELGSDAYCYATLGDHDPTHGEVDIIARVDPRTPPANGERIYLRIRPGEAHAFSTKTGERLPG